MPLAVGGVQEVAFKVLPGAIASDPERLARFKREAQVLASLSHPNVAHVYGFEATGLPDGSTVHLLAMGLVEVRISRSEKAKAWDRDNRRRDRPPH